MQFKEILFGSEDYHEAIKLRKAILRLPLGMDFPEEALKDEHLQLHFGLFDGDVLKACVIIQPLSDTQVKLRQMAVATDSQRSGYGRTLVQEVENYLYGIGITEIIMHARSCALGFYRKMGYSEFGEEFMEVGIPHMKMKKVRAL